MKSSIYKKIHKKVLFGSAVAAASVCIVAVLCIAIMRIQIIKTGEQLGASAATDSMTALEMQMEESLLRLAQNKAYISEEKLAAVAKLVTVISENATATVSSPDSYLPQSVAFPDAAMAGVTVAQLRLADESAYAALSSEIGLLGNLSGLLVSQHDTLDYVASVYLGSESGISISADGDSDKKTNEYDPRTRGWYQEAAEAGTLTWTDIFVDNSGRGLGITCAMPFYGQDGTLWGIVGAGMLLDVLNAIVVETKLGETGYAFIADGRGDMIISDSATIDADNNVVCQNLYDILPPDIADMVLNGESGIHRAYIGENDSFIACAPLSTLPWTMVLVMNVEEVIAPALASEHNIIDMTRIAISGMDRMILVSIAVFAAALILALAGNTMLTRRLASGIAKPVIDLSNGAEIIGSGDLDHRLNVKTNDELEALADTFNAMIGNIKSITAEKERIGAELNVAKQIQADMLPSIFPAFPERGEFDLYATMQPAKEVGGDFYDFFLIDDNHLGFVIADVSGKSVPAALFMVIAKTLINNRARAGENPRDVFVNVNRQLCEGNETAMFVTAWMGVLEIDSGIMTYVNAGHNPPLIKKKNGTFQYLRGKRGFVLAGMNGYRYKEEELRLEPGDLLFLYTDGVTEANNPSDKLYGEERLQATLDAMPNLAPNEILPRVKADIDLFADGAPQFDDITMLAILINEKG